MGNESSKRVNQNRLAWSKVVDNIHQVCLRIQRGSSGRVDAAGGPPAASANQGHPVGWQR